MVPSLCTDAVSDVFLAIIEDKVETVNDVLRLVFNTYKEFKPFAHKFGFVAVGQSTTTIAYCSCHFSQSFGCQQLQKFISLYDRKGWVPCFADTSLSTSLTTYKFANKVFAFVKDKIKVFYLGQSWMFYLVVVPDAMAAVVELDDSVSIKGREGWVPGTFIATHQSSNPFLHYKWVDGELHNLINYWV